PGRIKQVVDIPDDLKRVGEDVRSTAEFGRLRHVIWELLREEVLKAEEQEKQRKLALAPRKSNSVREVSADV
ncbi:MAG: ABC transporter ATP-binding protein, partial [Polyangiaceae bacterium]